ncbi:hypothetical protein [Aminobacter sp. BE322]|uniref:hypothetical protein n=1 Tax=unclassified Aminobacter TaxID=2644704 RepID=UPI003D1D6898
MRHSLAIAILLGGAALAAPAAGEDASAPSTMPAQVDPGTTASTGSTGFAAVMSSIQASSSTATAIQSLTAVTSVNIVKVAAIASKDELQKLDQAEKDNQADITGVQAAIMANALLKEKLDAENVDTSSILAANVAADGAVTVFVR